MFELTKEFHFDAAHTLEREIDTEQGRRVHGHSYRAAITLRGRPDPKSGMLLDLGLFERALHETRDALDHHFLNDVQGLGKPTLENLCVWIWQRLAASLPNLARITVGHINNGDACTYYGPNRDAA